MSLNQETKRAHWFEHVQQCESSPLSQKAYCEQQGLSFVQFQYYRKRYSEMKTKAVTELKSNGFIEVPLNHSQAQSMELN